MSEPTADNVTEAKAIDRMPKMPAEWVAFAKLDPIERCAAYLRSIRAGIIFFVVLAAIGIAAAFILGLQHGTGAASQ